MPSSVKVILASLILLFAMLLLTGCASLLRPTVPLAAAEADQKAKLFEPDINKASVYIFREGSGAGVVATFPITVDGYQAGRMISGTYFLFKLAPGEHDIWVQGAKGHESIKVAFPVNVSAGEIYFIEQTFQLTHSPQLTFVDKERGMEVVRKCELMEKDAFKAPALFGR